jgi:hypothetical protein
LILPETRKPVAMSIAEIEDIEARVAGLERAAEEAKKR